MTNIEVYSLLLNKQVSLKYKYKTCSTMYKEKNDYELTV